MSKDKTAEEFQENNFDGLWEIVKDEDLIYFYKGVISEHAKAFAEHWIKQALEEQAVKILCQTCVGRGYTVDVVVGCCNSPDEQGNCCGFPQPMQEQKQCSCYYGLSLNITPEAIKNYDYSKIK